MLHLLLLLGFCTLGVCLPRQYHFVNDYKTWYEAQSYCRELYVDLASIDSLEEGLQLISLVNIRNIIPAWIGLYDDLNIWRWSLEDDDFYKGNEGKFRNWYIEKPTNRYGNHLCALYSTTDMTWAELSCSSEFPFICYDGSVNATERYVVVSQYMNWTEAQSYCREFYTDLVSVRNDTENRKLKSVFLATFTYAFYTYDTWIGLYRTSSWSDRSNSSFSNWKPGQPDNAGENEHCTAVSFSDFGQWTDENCIHTLPFLCYSATSPTSVRQYHFVNESKTWTEAQSYCREYYTDLATIDNMEEMNMLNNTANGSCSGLAWIGLYDDLDGWRWSLDDDSFYKEGERDYRAWTHQPDNYGGNELCVYMSSSGTWFDKSCNTNYPFICYDGRAGSENYIWITQRMSWPDAKRYCREHHTDLASVRNWAENQRIVDISGGSDVWIGLYRTRQWSDQHSSTYENWRPGLDSVPDEPNNGLSDASGEYGNQHCTAISFSDSGQWTDENCLATLPFVCYSRFCTGSSCVPHQYHFINEPKTWAAAQRYCRENYTDLATFDNVEEVNRVIMTVGGSYSGLAWIGLYDDLNSWRWSLDEDGFYKEDERNFRKWYTMKPKNPGGESLCVSVLRVEGTWHEYPCDTTLGFICYDGREDATERYAVHFWYLTWNAAQSYCREHYTDLVSVRNDTENQKLKSLLRYQYDSHFWIGLYRTRSWSDRSNSSFSNWKPGQPDNAGGNEYCTAVSFNDFGQWTDENCIHTLPFLCYSDNKGDKTGLLLLYHSTYHFVNESKNWTEAQSYCREYYTDLATIDDMEEMNMLNNTANGSYSGLAWIGLYDDLDGWRWSLDNDSFYMEGERDYRGWYREPDNKGGNELCVYMSGTEEWYDVSCDNQFGFVCYNGKSTGTYFYFSNGKTWAEAQSYCRTYYTDLASVRNETEMQQILRVSNGELVWIGLYRNRLWSDQSNSTFKYWRLSAASETPEPDNGLYSDGQHGNQQCTAVDLKHSARWTDNNCLARLPFICYSGPVVGLRMKVKAAGNLAQSQIKALLLEQLQHEFGALGFPSNFTVKVKNLSKSSP
ncbi:macrophage mannose receptor 1-like [Colossoma macropomum]|uniref:macrophage mannose receptor 1-like n=1 Tax=Colossoma macropomum TaxID=42526 RepID=UPI0018648E17|nr:macrophage mannose receptor 1-like [Colossoma macropomum]